MTAREYVGLRMDDDGDVSGEYLDDEGEADWEPIGHVEACEDDVPPHLWREWRRLLADHLERARIGRAEAVERRREWCESRGW